MPSETKNRFLLLYGSQTGQAKAIAEEIQEKSDRYELIADLHCLSQTEKKFNLERESCMVIVCSTTGDGDAPDTAQKFIRRLNKKTLPDTHLQHLHYSLLGLGDSNYTNFCKCSKALDRRIEQLGAKKFYPSAWADDGVGLEVAAEPWIDNILPAVRTFLGLPPLDIQPCETLSKGKKSSSSPTTSGADNPEADATDSNSKSDINAIDLVPVSKMESSSSKTDSSCTADTNSPETNGIHELNNGANDSIKTKSDNLPTAVTGQQTSLQLNGPVTEINGSTIRERDVNLSKSSTDSLLFSNKLQDSGLTLPLLPPPYLQISFTDNKIEHADEAPYQNGCPLPSASTPVTMATVMDVKRLTTDDAVKTTLDLTLTFESGVLEYEPGDSISVICPNPGQEIQLLFQRLDVVHTCNQLCELTVLPETTKRRAAIPSHIPPQSTLQHIFSTCVDIRHPPKKAFLRVLVECTSDAGEKRRLQELCSKQGATEYTSFIHDAGISLLDILTAFPSCSPPISRLLEHLPRLQPRPYSVASSPLRDPGQLHIVFNIVEIEKGDNCAEKKGVCTGWLESITKRLHHGEEIEEKVQGLQITEENRVQDLQITEVNRVQDLQITEEKRVQGLQMTEENRLQDLQITEEKRVQGLQITEENRLQDLQITEENRVQGVQITEENRVQGLQITEENRVQGLQITEENRVQDLQITEENRVDIPIFGRTNNNFRLPDDLSIPLILIGPGTGVAPFIGFLQHREQLLTNQRAENVGKVFLFFGCRHEHRDFLYRTELERLSTKGILSKLSASFSRDLQKGDNSRYVQDSLRNHAAQVIEMIEEKDAIIYVCGDAKHMARNVNETFVEMYQSEKGLSEKDSKCKVMSLRLSRRYLEDVWT